MEHISGYSPPWSSHALLWGVDTPFERTDVTVDGIVLDLMVGERLAYVQASPAKGQTGRLERLSISPITRLWKVILRWAHRKLCLFEEIER